MNGKALVVIDIQNDITKHYRDIIHRLNSAIDWAAESGMEVLYIKHNNLSAGTRTFKPGTKGEELAPELKVVSDKVFIKTKASALTSESFSDHIRTGGGKFLHVAARLTDHEMHVQKSVGILPQSCDHGLPERDIRHKMAVHNIQMEHLCSCFFNAFDFRFKITEISCQQ